MGVDADVCRWIAGDRPVVLVPPVRNKLGVGAFVAHRRAIRRVRPDVFHANLREMADARHALLAAESVRGVRVVAVDQLPLAPTHSLTRWFTRVVAQRVDRRVAVGERAARLVEDALDLAPGRVLTIYNGVPDVAVADPPATGRMVVGTFARLDRIKGLDVLLDAVAPLDVSVVIAGEGPERGALETRAGEHVEFVGWRDDTSALLASIDVYVLPSRNEGFPLSIVEAMLAARPVVATAVGSVAEAVIDGRTGFVVRSDDVDALRRAIAALADAPELRRRMGAAGRAHALEHFTDVTMARSFEALYDEVCG